MKIAKLNVYSPSKLKDESESLKVQVSTLDKDLTNVFLAMQGRIRFGAVGDGDRGENISGEWQVFTSSATPDAENTIAHTIGAVPQGYIIVGQDKAGSLYQLAATGTAWTSTNLYLKCDIASVTFNIFLLK